MPTKSKKPPPAKPKPKPAGWLTLELLCRVRGRLAAGDNPRSEVRFLRRLEAYLLRRRDRVAGKAGAA